MEWGPLLGPEGDPDPLPSACFRDPRKRLVVVGLEQSILLRLVMVQRILAGAVVVVTDRRGLVVAAL